MRIGIDGWYLAKPFSSIGKMLINTLRYWKNTNKHDFVLFLPENKIHAKKYKDHFEIVTIKNRNTLKFYWNLSRIAEKLQLELLFFPFDIAPFYNHDYVVMVHDLIFLYFERNPKNIIFSFLMKNSIKKAKRIITPSDSTKKELIERYNLEEKIIKSIHLGLDPIFRKIPLEIAKKKIAESSILPENVIKNGYILHVGRIKPRYKNIITLLRAYAEYREIVKNKPLVIVSTDIPPKHAMRIIINLEKEGSLFIVHNIPEETLALLYNLADYCVYPSLYEGFGLNVLEALGCGKPVIVSNISAHREVVGNAGLFFDPINIRELKELMIKLTFDYSLRQSLSEKAREKAKIFNWKLFAEKLLEELEEI